MADVRPLEEWGEFELLSVTDAAFYLRVSEAVVRSMFNGGRLEGVEVGRALFFRKLHLIEFIIEKGRPHGPRP